MSSGCYGSSGRKVKHLTWGSAEHHRVQLENLPDGVMKMEVYQCSNCGYWHVGRKKADQAALRYLHEQDSRGKRDEVLVGKLIAAIKLVVGDKRV